MTMAIKDGREYRSIEMKGFSASEDDGRCIVEGYATTFDAPYDFCDGMKECICSKALDDADMSDVIFLLNHEGQVLARQRNNTLSVMRDDHGLLVRADLSGSQSGRELYEAIKNGLIDRMSWAFTIAEDGWEWNSEERTSYITKIGKVFDVSAVSRPANEDTTISARSYLDGVIEAERQELSEREKQANARRRIAIELELSTKEHTWNLKK